MSNDPKSQAETFLRALFGDPFPEGTFAALWSKPTGSISLASAEEVEPAVGKPDMYVSACLAGSRVAKTRRLTTATAVAMPGVWADIDVQGGPDQPATKRPAPTREAAMDLAKSILPPTLVVDSGYGLQAWWLFARVLDLTDREAHDRAQLVSLGWQALLRREANARDFTIDSTHDLARLMRLPGTYNDKGPPKQRADVTVLLEGGPRQDFEGLADIATDQAPRVTGATGPIEVDLGAGFPQLKHQAMLDNDDNYRRTWDHTRREREVEGWSTSEYDMSLASMTVKRGWTDDEIAALLVAHRKRHEGTGDPKAKRPDYIGRTIARARAGERRVDRERLREEALHEMAALGEEGVTPAEGKQVMALFNAVISAGDPAAPKFKELIQYSSDPDTARFVLVTEGGKEVKVGPYENLRNPRRLDAQIAPATGFVMDTVKDNEVWRDAIRALMSVRTVREEEDEPVIEWVRRYIQDRLGMDADEAAPEGEPFEADGYVYIKPESLTRFAKKVLAENPGRSHDVAVMLRQAGFEHRRVHHKGRTGDRRSTASYWRIEKEEL